MRNFALWSSVVRLKVYSTTAESAPSAPSLQYVHGPVDVVGVERSGAEALEQGRDHPTLVLDAIHCHPSSSPTHRASDCPRGGTWTDGMHLLSLLAFPRTTRPGHQTTCTCTKRKSARFADYRPSSSLSPLNHARICPVGQSVVSPPGPLACLSLPYLVKG